MSYDQSVNHYEEGSNAYWAWINAGTWNNPCPENPHPYLSEAYLQWETGFDDAMEYNLYHS